MSAMSARSSTRSRCAPTSHSDRPRAYDALVKRKQAAAIDALADLIENTRSSYQKTFAMHSRKMLEEIVCQRWRLTLRRGSSSGTRATPGGMPKLE
jgi:hypothetical protein